MNLIMSVYSDLYMNADRCGPVDICITPAFSGSPNATIAWSFDGLTSDLSGFEVTVEVEGEGVVSKESVRSDERHVMVGNLQPSKNHIVTVTAMYTDKIERHTSLEHKHSGMCFYNFVNVYSKINKVFINSDLSAPTDIKVKQQIPGSSYAMIEWSYPEEATYALSQFLVTIKTEDGIEVCRRSVVSQQKQTPTNRLQPSTKYTISICADYGNGVLVESKVEHLNCSTFVI